MAGYNIDPFGKMAETQRWISADKLNRQQVGKQNALRDIQQQSAQLGLEQQQGDAAFRNMLAQPGGRGLAQQQYPIRYGEAFPQPKPVKPVYKDLGKGDYGEAGLYDVAGETPRYVGATAKKQPLVSMGEQETAFQKEYGKNMAQKYVGLQQSGADAIRAKTRYARTRQLLGKVKSGILEPAKLTAKRLASGLGLDFGTEGMAGQEALNAMAIDLTMDVVQRTKGAVSNKEMELFAQSTAGLGKSLEGNMLILEMLDSMADLEQGASKLARRYKAKHGKFDDGYYDELAKYHAENPLFTEELSAKISALNQGAQPESNLKELSDEDLLGGF